MVGIVIGVVDEGLTGFGIANQIGLGALGDGYPPAAPNFCPSVSEFLFLNFYFLICQRNQRVHRGESATLAVLDSF